MVLWAVPCLVSARIINVPAEYATIQAGIDASADGDTVLVAEGTYHERINFNGRGCTLASRFILNGDTSSIGETIIDGDSAGEVVTFNQAEGSATALIGLTIQNGRTINGSGIHCIGAGPVIRDNVVVSNRSTSDAGLGGGICCENQSDATIVSNWIIGNRAGYGAGIASYNSSPVIDRNFIFGNVAPSGELGGNGGGIYCTGPSNPIIRHNDIRGDSAFWGGGGISCGGNVQALISGNTIFQNIGGGVQLSQNNSILIGNVIEGNLSQLNISGGGIVCADFSGRIANNLIIGNVAPDAGGIYCYSQFASPFMANNVVCNNSAGGIRFTRGAATMINSIVWGNALYSISHDSLSLPLITYCDIEGGWPGAGNISADPFFRDPDIGDFRLLWIPCGAFYDSPCIDAGHPDSADAEMGCHAGLGTPRADMGAYGGRGNITGIEDEYGALPAMPMLLSNYPNPFNAQTTIRFSLPEAGRVEIDVFDILGRKVDYVFSGDLQAGEHGVVWDAGGNPSGIYLYRLSVGGRAVTGKMTLVK
jgi:hypothetical protein